jgi:hypothetical protein
MTNEPVMPLDQLEKAAAYSVFPFAVEGPNGTFHSHGITKRELFAAMAMQGMLANSRDHATSTYADIAGGSVTQADALLAALNALRALETAT